MRIVKGRPLPLGVDITGETVNFSINIAPPHDCRLLLYQKGQTKPSREVAMENPLGGIRTVALTDLVPQDYEYNYLVDGEVYIDPYAGELRGRGTWGTPHETAAHKVRGVVQSDPYDWEDDQLLQLPAAEIIAYSLHVRGFTKHSSAQVEHPGTFLGLQEKLPYLVDLGINQLQLMPVYDFEENLNYRNYWGYGNGYFFTPKGGYAAGRSSVNEFKDLVKACHRSGIEVILDLPFTAETAPQEIIHCLWHYVIDYHVDGFVVNPLTVPLPSLAMDPLLGAVKILHRDDRFQNTMRRFLKGDEGMIGAVMEQVRKNFAADGCYNYITSHNGFTLNDLVSYDGKHNQANGENNTDGPEYNYSWNCGVEGPSRKKAVLALRRRQLYNAMFFLFLSQGPPCLLAGDEFLNSQKGNNNVYCQDNLTAWLDWRLLEKNRDMHDFVRALIAFRKKHPVLHRSEPLLGLDQMSCGIPDISFHGESAWQVPAEIASRQLGVYFSGQPAADTDCFVIYNMHWEKHNFALPTDPAGGQWYVVATTQDGILERPVPAAGQRLMEVGERTVVVLIKKGD